MLRAIVESAGRVLYDGGWDEQIEREIRLSYPAAILHVRIITSDWRWIFRGGGCE